MYKHKYLKYKKKYLELKQIGGGSCKDPDNFNDCVFDCITGDEMAKCKQILATKNKVPQESLPVQESSTPQESLPVQESSTPQESLPAQESSSINPLFKIEKIIGPYILYFYKINLGKFTKNILLFGEKHSDFKNCDPDDDKCINIIDFINTITSNKTICIDFFLEQIPMHILNYNLTGGSNATMNRLRFHSNMFMQNENNIRVQKWDFRITNDNFYNILRLNDLKQKFLIDWNKFTYNSGGILGIKLDNIHRGNYDINYNKLLNFLLLDFEVDLDIMIIINFFNISDFLFSDGFYDYDYYKITLELHDIFYKLYSILSYDNYKLFLNFVIDSKFLNNLKLNNDIIEAFNYINRKEEGGESTEIIYDPLKYEIKIKDIIKQILKSEIEKLSIKKLNEFMITNLDQFVDFFYDILKFELKHEIHLRFIPKIDLIFEREKKIFKFIEFIKAKLNKSYEKFLIFCRKFPDIFGDGLDFREKVIDIMLNKDIFLDKNLGKRKYCEDVMGLLSAQTDLYNLLRMFTIFDTKKKRPGLLNKEICDTNETPLNIISYAGASHTLLYKYIFDIFFKHSTMLEITTKEESGFGEFVKINKIWIKDDNKKKISRINKLQQKIRFLKKKELNKFIMPTPNPTPTIMTTPNPTPTIMPTPNPTPTIMTTPNPTPTIMPIINPNKGTELFKTEMINKIEENYKKLMDDYKNQITILENENKSIIKWIEDFDEEIKKFSTEYVDFNNFELTYQIFNVGELIKEFTNNLPL